MNKRGFTLLELMAVILILGMIALIAVPQVNNIIKNAKVNTMKTDAMVLVKQAELYATQNRTKELIRFDIINGKLLTNAKKNLEYDGKVENATIVITKDKKIVICMTDGTNSVYKKENETKVTLVTDKTCDILPAKSEVNFTEEKETTSTFENVAAMKESSSLVAGKTVKTEGFYSKGDGGGAYYEIVNSSSLTEDGMTVISLTGSLKAKIVINNTMNVKQLGAKGDGVTDDASALTNIFYKLRGKIIYIPKGTYMVSSNLPIYANTLIYGDGENSIIKVQAGFPKDKYVLDIRNVSNVSISSLTVHGNSSEISTANGYSASTAPKLIDIRTSNRVGISNVFIKGNIGTGIRNISSKNINISNCTFSNVQNNIYFSGTGATDTITIDNNLTKGTIYGLFIYNGSSTVTNLVVTNNTLDGKEGGFIKATNLTKAEISNNKIINSQYGMVIQTSNNLVIKNNYFDGEKHKSSGGEYGISLETSSNIDLDGNTIKHTGYMGIRSLSNTNAVIRNNTLEDCGYRNNDFVFAHFDGASQGVVFMDNTLIRKDETLSKYLLNCYGEQNTQIVNNKLVNGTIILRSTAKGYVITDNKVGFALSNQAGTNNTYSNNVIE